MKRIRYWLSALFIDWGIRLVPDAYPKLRLQMGIGLAVDMMMKEMEDAENGEMGTDTGPGGRTSVH